MCSPKLSQKGVRVYLIVLVFFCYYHSLTPVKRLETYVICLCVYLLLYLILVCFLVCLPVSACLCLSLPVSVCLCLSVSAYQTQVWDTTCGSGTGPVQSRKDHTNQNEWDILVRRTKTCTYLQNILINMVSHFQIGQFVNPQLVNVLYIYIYIYIQQLVLSNLTSPCSYLISIKRFAAMWLSLRPHAVVALQAQRASGTTHNMNASKGLGYYSGGTM